MSEAYEEIVGGETLLRKAPGARHERICAWLHARLTEAVGANAVSKVLSPRSVVQLAPGTMLRPDLALVTVATGKIWLAVEIVSSDDHRPDTVLKKTIYEEAKTPRLWMVDPRYDNVEVYHTTPYGLALRGILASKENLQEPLLPEFSCTITEIFSA